LAKTRKRSLGTGKKEKNGAKKREKKLNPAGIKEQRRVPEKDTNEGT